MTRIPVSAMVGLFLTGLFLFTAVFADFIARTGADELMVTGSIWDHEKRKRSFEIAAESLG